MKACPRCGLSNPDYAVTCECLYEFGKEGAAAVDASFKAPGSQSYSSTSNTARTIAQVISAIGWAAALLSGGLLLGAAARSGAAAGLVLFPSIAGALGGMLLVGVGQFTRAAVDTADHTGEILAMIKGAELSGARRIDGGSAAGTAAPQPAAGAAG